jgi:Tyrosine phosphatase family
MPTDTVERVDGGREDFRTRLRSRLAAIQARRMRVRAWFKRHWLPVGVGVVLTALAVQFGVTHWYDWFEKRVWVVEPGQLVRGAFQRPGPLRRVIAREHIRTLVTLSAVGEIADRFEAQAAVVKDTGVAWKVVPILGSRPSLEQMAEASDLLADRSLRPTYFHCVAGHHRTSLALAAYRIRHEGWSARQAWDEISSLPWASAETDVFDHEQVERFAAEYGPNLARR